MEQNKGFFLLFLCTFLLLGFLCPIPFFSAGLQSSTVNITKMLQLIMFPNNLTFWTIFPFLGTEILPWLTIAVMIIWEKRERAFYYVFMLGAIFFCNNLVALAL